VVVGPLVTKNFLDIGEREGPFGARVGSGGAAEIVTGDFGNARMFADESGFVLYFPQRRVRPSELYVLTALFGIR
jgi:hypothetical protein